MKVQEKAARRRLWDGLLTIKRIGQKHDSVIRQKALNYMRRSYSVMVFGPQKQTKPLQRAISPPKKRTIQTDQLDKQLKTMESKVLCI